MNRHPRRRSVRLEQRRRRAVTLGWIAAALAGIVYVSSLLGAVIWLGSDAARDTLTQDDKARILDWEGDRDGVGEVSIENKYGVVIPESDARWDCESMGNTECGR